MFSILDIFLPNCVFIAWLKGHSLHLLWYIQSRCLSTALLSLKDYSLQPTFSAHICPASQRGQHHQQKPLRWLLELKNQQGAATMSLHLCSSFTFIRPYIIIHTINYFHYRGPNSVSHENELHPTSIVINVTTNIKSSASNKDSDTREERQNISTEEVFFKFFRKHKQLHQKWHALHRPLA